MAHQKRRAKREYTNGYKDKISYWKGRVAAAFIINDADGVAYAESKVQYFTKRQQVLDSE